MQRSSETIGENIYHKHLKQIKEFDLKSVAREAGVNQRHFKEKQQVTQDQRSINEGSGEGS